MHTHRPNRRLPALALTIVLAVLAAACTASGGEPASGEDDATSTATSTGTSTPTSASADEGDGGEAFPVSVSHRHGTTEIAEKPERVVTVGLTDHDTVLALGVTPVAVTDWYGDQPHGVWPWAQDELGDAEPTVLPSDELAYEEIAAADPDLILGVDSDLTEKEHQRLSQIAPTVAQSADHPDFGTPWQEKTRVIGTALGATDEAEKLVDDVEAQFAAAREAHPEFDGQTAVIALTGEEGNQYPYGPQDSRARFMQALGFELSPEIAELAGDEFFTTISAERFDLLNGDVLVWIPQTQAQADELRDDPVYQQQPVAQEGRDVFLSPDGEIGAALSYNTVLSLPVAIDGLVPLLPPALDGDPETEVPTP